MAGTITHEWVGTTLIITSDSGTSGCDLKGGKGDMGIRGPQGPAGVVINGDEILIGYATEEYVNTAIANALSEFADGDEVNY